MSDEKLIDPQNKTWKRGNDPAAAAIALAEASMGTTGSGHHAGEAATQMRAAEVEVEAEPDEKPKAAAHKPAAHKPAEAKSD